MSDGFTVETLSSGKWSIAAGPFAGSKEAERARSSVLARLRESPDKDRPTHIRVRKTEHGRTTTAGREQHI